eukprot:jgi/Botrbrau1/15865/Bobra.40_1s0049.1
MAIKRPWSRPWVSLGTGGLDFRDAMLALGKLDRGVFGDNIGSEFSGSCSQQPGKKKPQARGVMGIVCNGIATRVWAKNDMLWDLPRGWSHAEAATVPMAYATAYYALVMKGGLRAGMSVLVQSGARPVGLAALRLCLSRGCKVFTTCGSEEEKAALLELFPQLDACRIGDSHSTSFEQLVMKAVCW